MAGLVILLLVGTVGLSLFGLVMYWILRQK